MVDLPDDSLFLVPAENAPHLGGGRESTGFAEVTTAFSREEAALHAMACKGRMEGTIALIPEENRCFGGGRALPVGKFNCRPAGVEITICMPVGV